MHLQVTLSATEAAAKVNRAEREASLREASLREARGSALFPPVRRAGSRSAASMSARSSQFPTCDASSSRRRPIRRRSPTAWT
jgi:hypothetical protein